MNSKTDKLKGVANEAIGKAKRLVGAAIGDDALRAKGVAQEFTGAAQKAGGEIKDLIKETVDKS